VRLQTSDDKQTDDGCDGYEGYGVRGVHGTRYRWPPFSLRGDDCVSSFLVPNVPNVPTVPIVPTVPSVPNLLRLRFMRITVAHSPDSDDAFMFYGLASGAVQTDGLEVDQVLADIETLNRCAFEGKYEVTAVSFHAYAHLVGKYALLPHGASMGDKYGPILVARSAIHATEGEGALKGMRIGIPGRLTSAYLTLQMFDPDFETVIMPFDEIQQAVLDGRVDAGLLIHEGQLTYAADGLQKVVDLGEWWFDRTGGLPLPLGGNIIRRDLGPDLMRKISTMLHDSIAHALDHRSQAVEYAQQFGRGLDRKDTDTFVGMYVNQLTLDYGGRGRAALDRFFGDAFEKRLIPSRPPVAFVS
jgi:1,4-dihydroxy-6-naphthoate synthase